MTNILVFQLSLICTLLICSTLVLSSKTATSTTAKKSSSIAVPKSKKSKKVWKAAFGSGFVGRIIREAKTAFCSELEALTIQMTRPDDSSTPTTSYAMLATCLNQDYEDAEFITSVISKLSRKFKEENVYTKLKSLLCLEAVIQKLNDDAQHNICDCISTLISEEDPKFSELYFLNTINPKLANNVAELETFSVLKEYYPYLFQFIALKGMKSSLSSSSVSTVSTIENKIKSYTELLKLNKKIMNACQDASSSSTCPLFKQLVDIVETDKQWAVKQLQKVCDVSICLFIYLIIYVLSV